MRRRALGGLSYHLSDMESVGAWAVFTIAGAIHSSANVASVTDNGTGDWTVNWAVQFGATTYAVAGCTRDQTTGSIGTVLGILETTAGETVSKSSVRVITGNSLGGRRDPSDGIYIVAIGRK